MCEDYSVRSEGDLRVTIIGLVSDIAAVTAPRFPLYRDELCVFLTVTDGYGSGLGRIVCVFEESGRSVFETPESLLDFGPDPLAVRGFAFRIQGCRFPRAGLYSVQFWYEGELIEERPVRLR